MYVLNFYCLVVSFLICLFGRYIGKDLAIKLNLLFLFLSLSISSVIFYESIMGSIVEVKLFNWISMVGLYINFSFFYDFLSSSMLFLVTFISFLVHIYSYNYMSSDLFKLRFFCYLSLFTAFMCLLVISESLLQFFLAWEGVGITSYLLINFWHTRYEANRSALKAVFINRFGDFGLYTGILFFLIYFKTASISGINILSSFVENHNKLFIILFGYKISIMFFIGIFLFLGVVGKSAQLGLHTWLPDAMEGPTPVSALLHAATMVTAGVYLLLRLSFFFEVSGAMLLISFWGALTAFVTSTIGVFQNDIKKIIAYSTCSQLGYMISACGLYNFVGAYFHLFNHAFFKALLFLGAGSIIHAVGDEQDLRKYGGLIINLPITYISFLIASIALMGLPFFSGFYSKDLILSWALLANFEFSKAIYLLLIFAAFCTTFYSVKILYQTFFSTPRSSLFNFKKISEGGLCTVFPLTLLSIFALSSGYIFSDLFIGYGNNFATAVNIEKNYFNLVEYMSQCEKFLPTAFVVISSLSFFFIIKFYSVIFTNIIQRFDIFLIYRSLYTFFNRKWFFDFFYYYIANFIMHFSYNILFKGFDRGVFERLFVKSTVWLSLIFSSKINFIQTGSILAYYMYIYYLMFILFIATIFVINNLTTLLILLIFYNILIFIYNFND